MKKIYDEDLAHNPPKHPGLHDLDLWTEEQMRKWIMKRTEKDREFITNQDDYDTTNKDAESIDGIIYNPWN